MRRASLKLVKVQPILPVADVISTVEYYRSVLGFREVRTWGDPPDRGFAARDRAKIRFAAATYISPGSGSALWAYVSITDVDMLFAEYQSKGIEIVRRLQTEEWGIREFAIRDINGHTICFGQSLSDEE